MPRRDRHYSVRKQLTRKLRKTIKNDLHLQRNRKPVGDVHDDDTRMRWWIRADVGKIRILCDDGAHPRLRIAPHVGIGMCHQPNVANILSMITGATKKRRKQSGQIFVYEKRPIARAR